MALGQRVATLTASALLLVGLGAVASTPALADGNGLNVTLNGQEPTASGFTVTTTSVPFEVTGCTDGAEAPASKMRGQVVLQGADKDQRAWADFAILPDGTYQVGSFYSTAFTDAVEVSSKTTKFDGTVSGALNVEGLTLADTTDVKLTVTCGGSHYYYYSGIDTNRVSTFDVQVAKTVDAATVTASAAKVRKGQNVEVTVAGFLAGEDLEFELHSNPVKLGVYKAGERGKLKKMVRIPDTTTAGKHHIVVKGKTSLREAKVAVEVLDVDVKANKTDKTDKTDKAGGKVGGKLAKTGANGLLPALAGALALGAAGLYLANRKRNA
ncbi:LPXTG cell wall anchor domain-containing protein [Buchananella felis]|uniref:LPXTG cell wall anchor domain-containing protein n=1 Tax=Buchananella felis TaxID=3231492 RepID=UPI0035276DC0